MQSIFDIINKKGYRYLQNNYDVFEKRFIGVMLTIIKSNPYIWKNFLENVLKNSLHTTFEKNIMIIAYDYLPKTLQISFDYIIDRLFDAKCILSKHYDDGFVIVKMYNETVTSFFRKSGVWLEYITLSAFLEVAKDFKQGIYIMWNNEFCSYNEIDILGTYEKKHYIVECKDTYLYDDNDFKRLITISKRVGKNINKVFVVTKIVDHQANIIKKYNITLIKYNYDYNEFVQNIKNLLIT